MPDSYDVVVAVGDVSCTLCTMRGARTFGDLVNKAYREQVYITKTASGVSVPAPTPIASLADTALVGFLADASD
ncbi:hypothetical protein IWQ56_006310, partial [Coemansia nantahalensis]